MARKIAGHILTFSIFCGALAAFAAVLVVLFFGFGALQLWQAEWKPQGKTHLRFREVALPFQNVLDPKVSLPFMAAAAIDIDGDGREELFLGGGRGQADGLFRFDGSGFVPMGSGYALAKGENDATLGAASIDIDGDGRVDLLVARESGVWAHMNSASGFASRNLHLPIDKDTTPLSIALGDVNKDGKVDFYVSGYIRSDKVEGQTIFTRPYGGFSYLFVNNGDNTWRDATEEAGLKRQHNTFTAVFVDLDNDLDSDLVIAQDTGVVEMYENTGSFPMRKIENPSVYSYPMGIAAGDYDNDGLIDLYFSNVGHTLPAKILRGDLPKDALFNPDFMMFHNDGGLKFTDRAKDTHTARLGFGWGATLADLDLDGREDLLIAQNYAKFPANALIHRYACKIMLQYANGKFRPVEKRAQAANRHFALAPVVADFSGDGVPDLVWANLSGPSKAFISKAAIGNAFTVRLPDNAASLGAIVEATVPDGRVITKQMVASQGLGSDQSANLIFGLGKAKSADVRVRFQDGAILNFLNQPAGSVLVVTH